MPDHAAVGRPGPYFSPLKNTMILLYTLLLITIGLISFFVKLRAQALENRYARVALDCDRLANQQIFKEGNSNRIDACKSARRQYELGQLVDKRDRLESKHFKWQLLADKLNRWKTVMRAWRGRKVPYTLGAVDVWLLMSAADKFGAGRYVNAQAVLDNFMRLFN